MKIAILGWGSLLWDKKEKFDSLHSEWFNDGPKLKLEFSRISKSRSKALTLVIDYENGSECTVAYSFSKRSTVEEAISDLMKREGTMTKSNIGFLSPKSKIEIPVNYNDHQSIIYKWGKDKDFDFVIWTDLKSNFQHESKNKMPFSIDNAIEHLFSLFKLGEGAAAKEYIENAPKFVVTNLRNKYNTIST